MNERRSFVIVHAKRRILSATLTTTARIKMVLVSLMVEKERYQTKHFPYFTSVGVQTRKACTMIRMGTEKLLEIHAWAVFRMLARKLLVPRGQQTLVRVHGWAHFLSWYCLHLDVVS